MISRNGLELRGRRWLSLLVLAAAAGCSRVQSPEQRIQIALATDGMTKTDLYPFAGTVTIDGQPPDFGDANKHLVVMLYNPQKPDTPMQRRPHVMTRKDGQFTFSEDGIPPGHYVATFAVFRRKGTGTFVGPDQINNLYNDPDRNANTPEFVIDHEKPEKKTINSIWKSRESRGSNHPGPTP
jgi:hypothetical protein